MGVPEKENFFSDPAYIIQVTILKNVGIWFFQDEKVKYIWKYIYVFTYVSGLIPVMHATYVDHSDDSLFSSLPLYIIILVSIVKYTNTHLNWSKVMKLIEILQNEWKLVSEGPCKNIMIRHANQQKIISGQYVVFVLTAVLLYVFFPMTPKILDVLGVIEGPTKLEFPYPVNYWCDDQENYYWILAHLCFCAYVVMSTVVGFDIVTIMFVEHVCAVYDVINYRLDTIADGKSLNVNLYPPKDKDREFHIVSDCIKSHNRIIEYCKILEEFYRWEYFVSISCETLLLTFSGIRLVLKLGDAFESARYFMFVVAQAIYVFVTSTWSQKIIDCSTEIKEAVIKIKWYVLSMRTRKLLNLIIIRSGVPNYLTVGKVFILSLEFFIAIIKTSMSYFTLLRSVQEEK